MARANTTRGLGVGVDRSGAAGAQIVGLKAAAGGADQAPLAVALGGFQAAPGQRQGGDGEGRGGEGVLGQAHDRLMDA
ncbi:MAG: hypothetical protein ACOYJ6_03535 [Caulobacterales bacterium]|jgi:hypothetical protein